MDASFSEWLYLQQIVGNFDSLVQYYFGAVAFFGPWFRQAGVGLIYSMGLAWAGFCFLKAPIDKLQHGLAVFGMVIVSGFLLSSTTNTKELGSASGTELSVGGYYSFYIAATMSKVFSDVLGAAWKNSIVESVGGGGPNKDAIALAYNDQAVKFAEKFIKGEGREAYVDYQRKCGSQALAAAKTPKEKAILKTIGIGAATLGMPAEDATSAVQAMERMKSGNIDLAAVLTLAGNGDMGGFGTIAQGAIEAKYYKQNQEEGKQFLKNLPDANNNIDGKVGYRIPSSEYYKTKLSETEGTQTSTNPMFKSVSSANGGLSTMLANGATATKPGSEDDYVFYPKNCAELYEVANETMASLREGAKNVKGYENLPQSGSVVSMTAANLVDRGLKDQMGELAKQAGVEIKFDSKIWEETIKTFQAAMGEVGNSYNKFMLQTMIPFTIASMAMIVVLLIITFPLFACISVIFGHKILVTFFKLMAFPFLVVFVNNLLLILSANIISFNKLAKVVPETFMPGQVDVAGAIASMNTETVIYSVICIAEIAIVRLILWDDVKAVTSMNLGAAAGSATERGMGLAGKALALVGGAVGRVGALAKAGRAAKAAEAAKQTNNHIANISQAVSKIASKGGQLAQGMGGGSPTRGQNNKSNQPGGSPNGGPGTQSLNPPKP